MATYYGYAERDANSYVDWGKLGQNLTDTVQTAYKIREEKKQQLDDLMQKNYAELANSPTGDNQDINGAITGFSDNSKQYLLQVNKLLKAGILQPKDYTLIMQNIKEDTKSLFDNAKNWQDAYGKILERNKNSTGSKAELDIAADVAAFGKFKNLNLMINPTTGRVSGAQMTKGPNGELIKGDTKSMQQLNVLMNQPIDKYQLTNKLTSVVDKLGQNQIAIFREARIQKNGEIREIQDPSLKATFDAAKNGFIKEVMSNPFNVMSILTDHQGVIPGTTDAYKVSTNLADRGKPNVIMYVDPDGDGSYTPELTPAQKKVAEQYVTDQFLGLIDHKEASQAIGAISPYTPPEYVYERGDKETEKKNAVGAWDKLRSGTAQEKQDAADILLGTTKAQNAGLIDIDLTSKPGSVILTYDEPKKNRTIDITDNGARWSAIGVELHGENDVNKARKAAGGSWEKPINRDFANVRASREGSDYTSQMSSYTSKNVAPSVVEDDYARTAKNLNEKYKNLGFSVKGDYEITATGAKDYIVITAPNGDKSEKIYIDDTENIPEIEAFLNSKMDVAKARNVFGGQGKTTKPSGGASSSGGNAR